MAAITLTSTLIMFSPPSLSIVPSCNTLRSLSEQEEEKVSYFVDKYSAFICHFKFSSYLFYSSCKSSFFMSENAISRFSFKTPQFTTIRGLFFSDLHNVCPGYEFFPCTHFLLLLKQML